MYTVCPLCDQHARDGNLYCEKPECPAERALLLLDEGDLVGDLEIVKTISVLHSAAIYEALRHDEKVFVKVAHQGEQHRERLKREAAVLRRFLGSRHALPYLPTLLPPFSYAAVGRDDAAYGKIGFSELLLYYYVFAHSPSEALGTVLARQPQLWINHVGWIMVGVATAVSYLQRAGISDFALCPDAILVRFDDDPPRTPRVLLADLGVAAGQQDWSRAWYPELVPPAYAAPELIDDRKQALKHDPQTVRVDPRTDVYGLGATLYELLVGEPPVTARPRSLDAILEAIQAGNLVEMSRREDVRSVAEIALQATAAKPAQRTESPATFGKQLLDIFGDVPEEKKRRAPSRRTIFAVIGALLLIAILLALALALF